LLGREGIRLNHKKLYRLYREERLMVRKIASLSGLSHASRGTPIDAAVSSRSAALVANT
jgi:hypothetical protein